MECGMQDEGGARADGGTVREKDGEYDKRERETENICYDTTNHTLKSIRIPTSIRCLSILLNLMLIFFIATRSDTATIQLHVLTWNNCKIINFRIIKL